MRVTVRRGREKCRVICLLDSPWCIGSSPLKKLVWFIYLVLGLCMCGLVPSCDEWELVSGFGAQDSHYGGFSCGTWAQVLQGMRGSSWIQDRTHVSCSDRWILSHGATREAWFFLCLSLVESTFFLGKESHTGNGEVTLPIFPVTVPYWALYHMAWTGGGKQP